MTAGAEYMNLPFEEAIAYFKSKGYAISPESWRDLWQAAQARAFTVARVTAMDVLQDIRAAAQEALDSGITQKEFISRVTEILEQKGWLAPKGEAALEILPDGSVRKRLTASRLETIYRTNVQTAYQVGRYKQMEETKEARPYWQYMAILDGATRPSHAAMHGKVYHADHPVWDQWYPPNGFNCRCYVKTLSERQLDARGLTEETAGVSGYPDEGWNYNPGRAGLDAWQPDMDRYDPRTKALLDDALAQRGNA